MAKLELEEGESILREDGASLVQGMLQVVSGRLICTNDRLVFVDQNMIFLLFGLLGYLLSKLFPSGKVVFEKDLNAIKAIARGKYGWHKHVLVVETGEKPFTFLVPKFDVWSGLIREAVEKAGASSEAVGTDRWEFRRVKR
jgi:hypothetical protein